MRSGLRATALLIASTSVNVRAMAAAASASATAPAANPSASAGAAVAAAVDAQYPGTAVQRLRSVHARVRSLNESDALRGDWEEVRRKLLWAGGLRDLPHAVPGQGYTGHSFNDWNHVDLTCMLGKVAHSENEGRVVGIAQRNQLGPGIEIASLPELGPGGSWSTCMMGCQADPPRDVAHLQFQSRIAFKLVWVPGEDASYDRFVLVDDAGALLATGSPSGSLPALRERQYNYRVVQGSKYAAAADQVQQQQQQQQQVQGMGTGKEQGALPDAK